jgi:hypothetical protein
MSTKLTMSTMPIVVPIVNIVAIVFIAIAEGVVTGQSGRR